MKVIADLHVHTVASGHAYSTILENVRGAVERGIELIAITDHGPAMPGAPHKYHFSNLRVLPRVIHGVEILKGVEANIIDAQGNIDLSPRFLKNLDIVLAGFHGDCYKPGSVEKNTRTLVRAMASGKVDVIVHPGNPAFRIDPQKVAQAAFDHNVLLEINNTSLSGMVRKGSRENCQTLAQHIARLGGRVCLGSDAHFSTAVGKLDQAVKMAEAVGLEADQVVNTSQAAIKGFLRRRGHDTVSVPSPQV